MLLRDIHAYYGEFLQLVPIAVLLWALFSRRGSFQRLAPIALDVNVVLGLLVYLVTPYKVSLWHPMLMLVATLLAHGVSRTQSRAVLIGGWVAVLAVVAFSIQIAAGRINV